jgi:hypothetical protein
MHKVDVNKQNAVFFTMALVFVVVMAIAATGVLAADQPFGQSPANAPQAVVAKNVYTFDEVLEGEVITHAFVIENQGTVSLDILNIRTSCGCTTARRPNAIAPGSSGQIEVKGDTRGYGGHLFDKSITVYTNDPLSPELHLRLKGPVGRFALIEPNRIVLRGETGTSLNAQTTIIPNSVHPFRIIEVAAERRLAGKINVQLEEQDGKYRVTIHNRQTVPGQYRGRVIVRTDSTLINKLFLYVIGDIKA